MRDKKNENKEKKKKIDKSQSLHSVNTKKNQRRRAN